MSAQPRPDLLPQLLVQLAGVLKQAQVYDLSNGLFTQAIPALAETVRVVGEDRGVSIDLVADSFFINKTLVKLATGSFEASELLKKLFTRFSAQQLQFGAGVREPEVRAFLGTLQGYFKSTTPGDVVKEQGPIRFATVTYATGGVNVAIDARQNVLRVYARLAAAINEIATEAAAGRVPRTANLRRAAQALAQASEGHDALLAGLTRFPNFSGALHFHLTAVAALCLLMGRRLQLSRPLLLDLVVGAALHDLGLERRDAHSTFAAVESAVRAGFTDEALLQATVTVDVNALAFHDDAWAPGPLGRLIAVPCAFDRLTSGELGAKALAPDQALRAIQAEAGGQYDRRVVTLFTATVGLFPIGSLVRLTNGALAVVLAAPQEARNARRPMVKVIRDERGPCDVLLDLALDPSGPQVASAAEKEPETEAVNPTAFLLA